MIPLVEKILRRSPPVITAIAAPLGAMLLVLVLGYFLALQFAGRQTVWVDGVEQPLPDWRAVYLAIQEPQRMSDFDFYFAVKRLSEIERRRIAMDFAHLHESVMPSKMAQHVRMPRD